MGLGQIRGAQGVDFRDNQISTQASDGSVNWIRLDNLPVMGRLVVINRRGGLASSYDCCTCLCPSGYVGLSTSPASVTMIPGQTTQFKCACEFIDCNGYPYYQDYTSGAIWSSSNTSVATVSNGGLATAVAAGTGRITASHTPRVDPLQPFR